MNIETPALVIDYGKTIRNIKEMQALANKSGKRLRPHAKTHKIPYLAHLQINEGAVGICAQKVSEAEVFAKSGINDILISNEVLGEKKIRKIFELINLGNKISVAVDSHIGIRELETIGKEYSNYVEVLVDVDVGMNRCGVNVNDNNSLEKIVDSLKNSPHVLFKGFMGYDGHTANIKDLKLRAEAVEKGYQDILKIKRLFEKKGLHADIVSVGGTPSASLWALKEEINELQPGTYVFYDIHQVELGVTDIDHISAYVLSQVISRAEDRVVLDVGYKGITIEQGIYPTVVSHKWLAVKSMSEEHTVLKGSPLPDYEEKVQLIPYHVCPTIDLWDEAILVNNDKVITSLKIEARGKKL
ncbi:alanine racemase [Saccharolobus sp. A20]|uniref:alanine racemase n=1 Tax=Saccharolobus sp. A20 TaxID=1891280 RepID=UPI0018D493AE|nr:alanine racemase [Sulfolobus sp. A20]